MENTLQINDQQLMIKEYNNQRVVTMWDIANLHGVPQKNIRDNFTNNLKYLIEEEDYYLLEKRDDFVHDLIVSKDISKKAVAASKNIPVFTETGYLMITKPMTDELSWQVQRLLIKSYFKAKEIKQGTEIALTKEVTSIPLKDLSEINRTIELMQGMFKNSMISDEQRMSIVSELLRQAGVNIPKLESLERPNKSNYIQLDDLAIRVGLLREDNTPNCEATMAIISIIGTSINDLNLTLRLGDNGGYWFNIKFNPAFVRRIKEYIDKNNYPNLIQMVSGGGNRIPIPVKYNTLL